MRYLAHFLAVMIASTSFSPSSAMAQSDIGSHVDHNKKRMAGFDDLFFQNSTRAGLNVASLCLAEKRPAQAIDTLSFSFMSEQQSKSLDKFFKRFFYDSSCNLTNHIQSNAPSVPVIGGLAEFFLLRKYKSNDIESLDQLTQSDWQKNAMLPRNSNESFGQCVVRANRASVFKLASTIPDTQTEADTIQALIPSLGPCVAEGQEVSFDQTALRAILVFSLYRAVSQHQQFSEAAE